MKYYLTIEKEDETLLEVVAPTFEILSEKVGAWERANKCEHICSGNCRKEGCNCACGEFHDHD